MDITREQFNSWAYSLYFGRIHVAKRIWKPYPATLPIPVKRCFIYALKYLSLQEQPCLQSDLWVNLKHNSQELYSWLDRCILRIGLNRTRVQTRLARLDLNTPYVARNVFSEGDRCLQLRDMLPEIHQGENVIASLDENGNPLLSSVSTPTMTSSEFMYIEPIKVRYYIWPTESSSLRTMNWRSIADYQSPWHVCWYTWVR